MLPRTLRPYKQAVAVRTRLTRWRRPRESGAKARPCFLENVRPGPPFGLGSQNGDARQTIRGGRRAAACLSVAGPTHCACAARVRWPGGAARSGSGCAPLCNCRGGGRGGVSGLWRLAGRSRGSRTGAPASERWCVRGRGGDRRALSGGAGPGEVPRQTRGVCGERSAVRAAPWGPAGSFAGRGGAGMAGAGRGPRSLRRPRWGPQGKPSRDGPRWSSGPDARCLGQRGARSGRRGAARGRGVRRVSGGSVGAARGSSRTSHVACARTRGGRGGRGG